MSAYIQTGGSDFLFKSGTIDCFCPCAGDLFLRHTTRSYWRHQGHYKQRYYIKVVTETGYMRHDDVDQSTDTFQNRPTLDAKKNTSFAHRESRESRIFGIRCVENYLLLSEMENETFFST